ncbi:MAG: protein kinase [Deltaproteobacteria bacterium]|nr:protein kinase [Deltaproteobacteria bacterium]
MRNHPKEAAGRTRTGKGADPKPEHGGPRRASEEPKARSGAHAVGPVTQPLSSDKAPDTLEDDPQSVLSRTSPGGSMPPGGARSRPSSLGTSSDPTLENTLLASGPPWTPPARDEPVVLDPRSGPTVHAIDDEPTLGSADAPAQADRVAPAGVEPVQIVPCHSEKGVVADPLIGLVVADRYRIVEQIGRGGMGIVYRVQHTSIGKLLAMKLLTGELSTNREIVRRFKQEALTVSKLSSPHTVQVFDYGVWQHLTYLVMELVDGQDLGRALRREGPMPFVRLGKLMVQVCTSLCEAHAKGIVHRDIKPENVLLIPDASGTEIVKVLDFGLAKLRESTELNEASLQGAVIGTPYFMSPEQVLGSAVDGRTDIYSLGAVMFRALSGTFPFQAASPMAMFTKHLTEPPPSLTERAPDLCVPEGVSRLVLRCMHKSPEERFQSVEELRGALLDQLEAAGLSSSARLRLDRPEDEEPPPPSARAVKGAHTQIATRDDVEAYMRKLRRQKTGARLLLVAGLVAAAAAGAYGWWQASRDRFTGLEQEPNNRAAEANVLPLGQAVVGQLGERIGPDDGDRDFFAFELPERGGGQRYIALRLDAIPNLPLCALLYNARFPHPLAQYCPGDPGQELVVPALRLEPGRYLLAVMQDRDPYGADRIPFVIENVSDRYRVAVELADPRPAQEVEPNDQPASAQPIAPGQRLDGTLPWVGDEDVYCAPDSVPTPLVWRVEDDPRAAGTVLEATALVGQEAAPLVRIHAREAKPFGMLRAEADLNSPWTSPPFETGRGRRCLRLQLTTDPWTDRGTGGRPRADGKRYAVSLVLGGG